MRALAVAVVLASVLAPTYSQSQVVARSDAVRAWCVQAKLIWLADDGRVKLSILKSLNDNLVGVTPMDGPSDPDLGDDEVAAGYLPEGKLGSDDLSGDEIWCEPFDSFGPKTFVICNNYFVRVRCKPLDDPKEEVGFSLQFLYLPWSNSSWRLAAAKDEPDRR